MSVLFEMTGYRHDVEVVKKTGAGRASRYFIKKPSGGELYEMGPEEYFLYTQLNGRNMPGQIMARFEKRFKMNLSEENLMAFVRQVGEEGLLEGYDPSASTLYDALRFKSPDKWRRWKMFDPGPLTAWLAARLSWAYSPVFLAASAALFVFAALTVFNASGAFYDDFQAIFEPMTILHIMAVSYCFLNIPCELARGVTSAHFGSRPTEFGVWLAYDVLPRFYLRSRVLELKDWKKRSWTLFASSYCSIMVWSLSVFAWRMSSPSTVIHELALILMVTAMIDCAVKLNVLWPSEACYLLSNSLGIFDFRRRAVEAFKSMALGRPLSEPLSAKEKWVFRLYGLLTVGATLPSVAVLAYLLGSSLVGYMAGAGALLFLAILAVKYGPVFSQAVKGEVKPGPQGAGARGPAPKKRRWVRILVVCAFIALMLVPYPYEAGGPFKFMPVNSVKIHTQVSGEIMSVPVKEGDMVDKGQPLAYLDTRENQKNYDITRADMDRAASILRMYESGPKLEEVKKAEQELDAAKTTHEFSKREAERLKSLFEGGAVSQEEYEKAAKTAAVDADRVGVARASLDLVKSGARPEEIEAQKANVRDLETKLKFYKENLSLAVIVSPIKGQVATPYIDRKVGTILAENELFAVVNDVQTIQAEVQVPESDLDEIKMGSRVKVRLWSQPTVMYYGTVVSIAPKAEQTPSGNIVRVLTEIPNEGLSLKPDMTGEAKIDGGWKPFVVAFTRAIVRFVLVEVWSWLP